MEGGGGGALRPRGFRSLCTARPRVGNVRTVPPEVKAGEGEHSTGRTLPGMK